MELPAQKIFLSGFMGSGKSTLGKKLSLVVNLPFYDIDELIEKKVNKTIPAFFSEFGETAFRSVEKSVLKELTQRDENFVCSLGGGSICNTESLQLVKQSGLLIYIQMPASALADRLKKRTDERPMLQKNENLTLAEHIQTLLTKREPFYKEAHLTVNGINLTAAQLLKTLIENQ